jgi:succinoglycan biosynthesis protein ExoM
MMSDAYVEALSQVRLATARCEHSGLDNAVEKRAAYAHRHMTSEQKHISVCICTFQRPGLLQRLLECLEQQHANGRFTFSVVVTDNDSKRSSERVVAEFAATSSIAVTYSCESRQNIALARNEALTHATGDFVAFIDDDEFPENGWLAAMLEACEKYQAAGVLGPVRPHFEEPPPRWIVDGRFFERPEHQTGRIMEWEEFRTGNLLFQRRILVGVEEVFNPEFGSMGEDKEFFMRMTQLGHVFRWCNEGVVYETVPKERWKRSYMLKRALLRGRNIIKEPIGRVGLIARSVVAAPVYLMVLPFALMLGQHVFMKYCIKFCDHAGRILGLLGVNPVSQR